MADTAPRVLTLDAADGVPLTITRFDSAGPPRAVVLLAPAMGAAQGYYAPCAGWLAQQGCLAITFDFRGMGASRTTPLDELDVDIVGWARLDAGAVLAQAVAWRDAECPGAPLVWVGHSLGAQIVPMVPGHQAIAHIVSVASGTGTWWHNAWPLWWRVPIFWFVLVPLLTAWAGYFPGKRLRMVGDLPAGVIRQWRRWCRDARYAVGVEGAWLERACAELRTSITVLSFADDEMMSARNTADLHREFVHAPQTARRVAPAELGLSRVGHFGFFRTAIGAVAWPRLLGPVLDAVAPRR